MMHNEVTNALKQSFEVRHVEMAEQGEALSPGALAWIDSITDINIELTLDAPETRPRTKPMHQDCEGRTCDSLSLCMEDNVLENATMGSMQHFERRGFPERPSINQVEPQEYSLQPADLLCLGLGRDYDPLCSSSLKNDVIMNDVENMVKEVQEAAFLAMHGGIKRHKNMTSSSNINDNGISTCPQQLNNEVDNLAEDEGRMEMEVHGIEQGVGEARTSRADEENHLENMAGEARHNIDMGVTREGCIADAHETSGDALKATDQVSQADIERTYRQAIESIGQLMDEKDVRDALPTSSIKPVGEAFGENKNVILSWLMNDEVSSIGIYGMGGVGKTTLLKHIYNQLLERSDTRTHLYWVTVSRDFNINRLQNLIAECLVEQNMRKQILCL